MPYTPRKTGKGCRKAGATLGAKSGNEKDLFSSRAGRVLQECKSNKGAGTRRGDRLLPMSVPEKKKQERAKREADKKKAEGKPRQLRDGEALEKAYPKKDAHKLYLKDLGKLVKNLTPKEKQRYNALKKYSEGKGIAEKRAKREKLRTEVQKKQDDRRRRGVVGTIGGKEF